MDGSRRVVTLFGSASAAPGNKEYAIAYELGKRLAAAGYIVCNGGYGGTMEASARGAKEGGGETIGIITRFYAGKSANRWIDTVIETETPVERLLRLIQEGQAFVCLKGGTGTLLELAAVWELMNKKVIDVRPIFVLGDHWAPVVRTVRDELISEGRKHSPHFVTTVNDPEELIETLTRTMGERDESLGHGNRNASGHS